MCDYKVGDLVWAKLKTYSPWPGRISIPIPELHFPKNFKNYWCIYLFGINNYQWIHKYYIKPYKEYKEEILKEYHTTALSHAVTQLELYIDNPEIFGEIDGPTILPDGTDFIKDCLPDLNKRDTRPNITKKEIKKKVDFVVNPYVKLERTDIYTCHGCTAAFLTQEELESHLSHPVVLLERVKIYECKICWLCFTDHKEYKRHALIHVKALMREEKRKELYVDSGRFKKIYSCPECDLRFVQASTLETHLDVHQPFPHVCHCGIGYYKNYDLAQHLKLAHGEDKSVVQVIMKSERKVIYKDSEEDVSESSEESDHSYVKVKARPKLKAATRTKPSRRRKCEERDFIPEMVNGSYHCHVCSLEFLTVAKFNKHYSEKHPSEMPYGCDKCSKKFMTYSSHKLHMITHEDPKYNCEYCNKKFHFKIPLEVHLRVHTKEKPYCCNICQKRFTQISALNIHKLRHAGIRNFKCKHCDKRFFDLGSTKLHERTHTGLKPYECTVKSCNKKFSDPSAYARHVRTHTGDMRYACIYCPKKFTDSSAYYVHKKRHENKKDFVCSFCEKTFLTLSTLRIHLRLHIKMGNNYECDICGSKLISKASLFMHMKRHMGGDMLTCKVCSKVCKSKTNLLRHQQKVHKIGKAYKCDVCNHEFWGPEKLNIHKINVHQDNKIFNCDYCAKKFWKKKLLRKHIIKQHLRLPKCYNCQKYFTLKSFESHLPNCKGKICGICDKRIPVTQLEAHLLTHA